MKQQNLVNFRNCFYGDIRCMDLLFADGSRRWISALGDILDTKAEVTTTQKEYEERDF